MKERAGHFKSNLSGDTAYESYVPNPLPPKHALEIDEERGNNISIIRGSTDLVVVR